MAAPPKSRTQSMLQAAVQTIQWTYSLFWQLCPRTGLLVWSDGYYNGAIKTRKTVQPTEVTTEEATLERSQQLKDLYESLVTAESNQQARRPSAALSPEDLSESEWFYLMCVSFSFSPGFGLPGKAYEKQQHVWLTGANEVDSKVCSRAILAKSARMQTLVCIPLLDGVVEFGTTERVQEDIGLVQQMKSYFSDYRDPYHLDPALSEHSTSNPSISFGPQFNNPSLDNDQVAEDEDDDDDDDDDGISTMGGSDQADELMQLDMCAVSDFNLLAGTQSENSTKVQLSYSLHNHTSSDLLPPNSAQIYLC